ncbi:hypothetical protein [Shumkonia mesophila]|uniref:hypothetical protein n=1 Tax=Shumkonia mesophila TaxID=2838854 RepID=UPI002934BF26|nr:hypothetical protein [Shumkonia mesophila]
MTSAETTTDHATIRRWVEARNGKPAAVSATHARDEAGILRIDFNDFEEGLEPISWDEFFVKFDEAGLAFLYQDRTSDGGKSLFFKLVRRDGAAH